MILMDQTSYRYILKEMLLDCPIIFGGSKESILQTKIGSGIGLTKLKFENLDLGM